MENTVKPDNKKFLSLLILFFAVFVGTGLFLLTNKPLPKKESNTTTSTVEQNTSSFPTAMPTRGSMKLVAASESGALNDEVNIDVVADSDNENVTSYDVLVQYDPEAFDFIKAFSLDDSFQVYSFKKDDRITLTVTKSGQVQTTTVFAEKPVIKLSFKSLKAGKYNFSILSSVEKETSKFVNDKTEIIYPQVGETFVTIK